MEADWEIEIGGDAPVIDAQWEGFVDLRLTPDAAARLPEAAFFPSLDTVLVRLNASTSPVWTCKCDVWHPDTFDRDELDAPAETDDCAVACYLDLLPRGDRRWSVPEHAAAACQALCAHLRDIPLRGCRADLIVRRASITPDLQDLGITAYLTACGSTPEQALATLGAALAALADSVVCMPPPADGASKLQ